MFIDKLVLVVSGSFHIHQHLYWLVTGLRILDTCICTFHEWFVMPIFNPSSFPATNKAIFTSFCTFFCRFYLSLLVHLGFVSLWSLLDHFLCYSLIGLISILGTLMHSTLMTSLRGDPWWLLATPFSL